MSSSTFELGLRFAYLCTALDNKPTGDSRLSSWNDRNQEFVSTVTSWTENDWGYIRPASLCTYDGTPTGNGLLKNTAFHYEEHNNSDRNQNEDLENYDYELEHFHFLSV